MITAADAKNLVTEKVQADTNRKLEQIEREKREREAHIKLVREVHVPEIVVPRLWEEITEAAKKGKSDIIFDVKYGIDITGEETDNYLRDLLVGNGYKIEMYQISHQGNRGDYGSRGIKISWG